MTHRSRDPLEETLAIFDCTAVSCTPLTAGEVAEYLSCPRRTAYDRLQKLTDWGDLRTKEITDQVRVWWREPDARRSERDEQFQTVTEQRERQRRLERQREQLAALNNLNAVVRDITEAVINQSTREEIERTVCAALAASDSYEFAWIGAVDVASETITLRAEAGVEGYLDDVTISVDPDDERSRGPAGRAVRTGEVHVATADDNDSQSANWRDHVEQYGFRSSAAIPIAHEGTVYGVLNVYADRTDAFGGQERTVIEQLGDIVGHAIGAVERKRALMSDEVVEVEFRIQDVFDGVDASVDAGGTISFDRTVPVGNDDFVVYGTATTDAVDALYDLAETQSHWGDLTVNATGDPATFELLLHRPPVFSAIASMGGSIEGAVIEDEDYRMTAHFTPSVDVRQAIDTVRESYPQAELLSRRQVSRSRERPRQFRHLLAERFTERQRAALETAYLAGFFEWPRGTSGEELADLLGVSPPTFHQHLRKAEQKVFDSLLG